MSNAISLQRLPSTPKPFETSLAKSQKESSSTGSSKKTCLEKIKEIFQKIIDCLKSIFCFCCKDKSSSESVTKQGSESSSITNKTIVPLTSENTKSETATKAQSTAQKIEQTKGKTEDKPASVQTSSQRAVTLNKEKDEKTILLNLPASAVRGQPSGSASSLQIIAKDPKLAQQAGTLDKDKDEKKVPLNSDASAKQAEPVAGTPSQVKFVEVQRPCINLKDPKISTAIVSTFSQMFNPPLLSLQDASQNTTFSASLSEEGLTIPLAFLKDDRRDMKIALAACVEFLQAMKDSGITHVRTNRTGYPVSILFKDPEEYLTFLGKFGKFTSSQIAQFLNARYEKKEISYEVYDKLWKTFNKLCIFAPQPIKGGFTKAINDTKHPRPPSAPIVLDKKENGGQVNGKPKFPRQLPLDVAIKKMHKNAEKAFKEHAAKHGSARLATALEALPPVEAFLKPKALQYPLTFKTSEAAAQGPRTSMEDHHFVKQMENGLLIAVFDGHGDPQGINPLAQYVNDTFAAKFPLALNMANGNVHQAFEQLIHAIHYDAVQKQEWKNFGTTAGISYLDKRTGILYHAILGDSEQCIYRKIAGVTKWVPCSNLRDWQHPTEARRYAEATIEDPAQRPELVKELMGWHHKPYFPFHRFNVALNVSRSVGDIEQAIHNGKEGVSHKPKITVQQLYRGDVAVLGCDGLRDNLTEEEICEIVETTSIENLAQELLKRALAAGRKRDNVSVIAVQIE